MMRQLSPQQIMLLIDLYHAVILAPSIDLTAEQLVKLDDLMDSFAEELGYDNWLTAATLRG